MLEGYMGGSVSVAEMVVADRERILPGSARAMQSMVGFQYETCLASPPYLGTDEFGQSV